MHPILFEIPGVGPVYSYGVMLGTSLIVGCGIARIRMGAAVRQMWPFYAAMIVVLLLVTYVPALTMTLPALMR